MQGYAPAQAPFATELVGKKFTIITADEIKRNDVLIDFQCINVGHQKPIVVKKTSTIRNFVAVDFDGGQRTYFSGCIFGKLNPS